MGTLNNTNDSFGNAIIISATKVNISLTNCNCKDVMTKALNRKRINELTAIKHRLIMKDMLFCSTVMITVVTLR